MTSYGTEENVFPETATMRRRADGSIEIGPAARARAERIERDLITLWRLAHTPTPAQIAAE